MRKIVGMTLDTYLDILTAIFYTVLILGTMGWVAFLVREWRKRGRDSNTVTLTTGTGTKVTISGYSTKETARIVDSIKERLQ
jgi:hypothetical protein